MLFWRLELVWYVLWHTTWNHAVELMAGGYTITCILFLRIQHNISFRHLNQGEPSVLVNGLLFAPKMCIALYWIICYSWLFFLLYCLAIVIVLCVKLFSNYCSWKFCFAFFRMVTEVLMSFFSAGLYLMLILVASLSLSMLMVHMK